MGIESLIREISGKRTYSGVAPRGRSIERPLLINGYAYLAVSLPDNGPVDSNSKATDITDRCLGNRSTNMRPARGNGTINPLNQQRKS
jgi:hypothetical protein